jgi:hypothetical protein
MADELDLQTNATQTAPVRDSGYDQSASLSPEVSAEAEDSLNALFEAETGERPPVVEDPSKPKENKSADDKDKTLQEAPREGELPDPTGEADLSIPDEDKEGSGETEDTEGETEDTDADAGSGDAEGDATDQEKEKDEFDKIELPPHTSTKAADSFNAVKEKARTEIEAREKQIQELQQKVSDFETRETVTPEEKTELEELRKFRASAEIEKDPTFQAEFTDRIEANDKIIYEKLTEAGMKDKQIEQIKEMGGPTKLTNWDAIYEHLTPTQKRMVDARLTDNENLLRDRDIKVKAAKENVDQYLEEKTVGSKVRLEEEAKVITESANEMLAKTGWAETLDIPKDATPEQKKTIEESNKYVETQVETLKGLLVDRSPKNHAMLAVGTIQALHLRKAFDSASAELKELRETTKQLQAKLDRVKKSGAASRKGSAPAKPVQPKTALFETTGEDALDSLRKEVSA